MPLGTETSELVLPGLDEIEPAPSVTGTQHGHWIEGGPQKRLMVFAGRSHPELAERIAEQLGVELGEVAAQDVRQRRDLQSATTSRSAAPTSSSSRPAATRSTAT